MKDFGVDTYFQDTWKGSKVDPFIFSDTSYGSN